MVRAVARRYEEEGLESAPHEKPRLVHIGWCALIIALSLPLIEHPHVSWTPRLFIAPGVLAVLSTTVAFSVQSWAQSVLPSTHIAPVLILEPVFAWITSYVVMGERLRLRPASGAVFILAVVALTEVIPQSHVPSTNEAWEKWE
jgi:drug/metabolite transporter (DMT)-like permease